MLRGHTRRCASSLTSSSTIASTTTTAILAVLWRHGRRLSQGAVQDVSKGSVRTSFYPKMGVPRATTARTRWCSTAGVIAPTWPTHRAYRSQCIVCACLPSINNKCSVLLAACSGV